MIPLILKPNVDPAIFPWNYGRSRDNTGISNGTALNEYVLGDHMQFFERMFARSGLVANNLVDNGSNGWQLHQALQQTIMAYKNIYTYVGNATLVDDNFGSLNVLSNFSNSPYSFTMPPAVLGNVTKKIQILNASAGTASTLTILMPGGNSQNPGYTIVLRQNDWVEMTTTGVGQYQVTNIFRYKTDKTTQINLSNFTTSGAALVQIPGAQFVVPAGDIRDYKLTFSCRLINSTASVNSNAHGADFYIQDQTLSSNIAHGGANVSTNGTGAGQYFEWQINVTIVYKNVPAGETLGVAMQRKTSVTDMSILDAVFIIEEISQNAI